MERKGAANCSHTVSLVRNGVAELMRAGGFCHFQADVLSVLDCRRLRLLAGDSSISVRIARRSSVAETTGKRRTSKHPKASRHCNAVNLRPAVSPLDFDHSQKAGRARSSHARLSSSSMNQSKGRQTQTPSA